MAGPVLLVNETFFVFCQSGLQTRERQRQRQKCSLFRLSFAGQPAPSCCVDQHQRNGFVGDEFQLRHFQCRQIWRVSNRQYELLFPVARVVDERTSAASAFIDNGGARSEYLRRPGHESDTDQWRGWRRVEFPIKLDAWEQRAGTRGLSGS